MRRVTLSGVPVHPVLVHFPVAFWIFVPLLRPDALGRFACSRPTD